MATNFLTNGGQDHFWTFYAISYKKFRKGLGELGSNTPAIGDRVSFHLHFAHVFCLAIIS